MKILSLFFVLLILIPVLCFALSNRQDVDVGLWPFNGTLQLPLYLVGLAPLAFGLLFGGFWGWLFSIPHRLKVRRLHKEAAALNERIGELQKPVAVSSSPPSPRYLFWKRPS